MWAELKRIFGAYSEVSGHPEEERRGFSALEFCAIFLLFFVIAFALQHKGFHSEMVYDSGGLLTQNEPKFAANDTLAIMGIVPARPLFMITFYFNYLLTGMDPYAFRVYNTLLLAAAGATFALLILIISELPGSAIRGTVGERRLVSVALGLLFVAHPLQSLAILYVWQREAIMACLFYFAGLAVYLSARAGHFRHERLGLTLTSLIFFAGISSKENVVTFPFVLLLAEVIFFRQEVKQTVSRAFTIALIVLPPALIHLLISQILHGEESAIARSLIQRLINHFSYAGLNLYEVVLTACRVIFSYLSMILFPLPDGVEFIRAETISRSLINPPTTLLAVVGISALIGIGIGFMRKQPVFAFGVLFFLVTPIPESVLIPQYLFFGYRAILPMAGILLVLGSFTVPVLSWSRQKWSTGLLHQASALIFLCLVAYFGAVTFHEAKTWNTGRFWKNPTDRLTAYNEDIEIVPYLDIAVNYLVLLNSEQRSAEIIDLFMKIAGKSARTGNPQTPSGDHEFSADAINEAVEDVYARFKTKPFRTESALVCLANALTSTGRYLEAIAPYRRARDANPRDIPVYLNLGALLEYSGKIKEAAEEYGKAVAADPDSAPARNSLGAVLHKMGNLPGALEMYKKAVELDPSFAAGHYNLANALALSGRVHEAIGEYRKTIEIDPNLAEAYHNLGRALAVFGKSNEAIVWYRKAIAHYEKKDGTHSVQSIVHNDLGMALEYSGDISQAIEQYRRAAAIDPEFAMAHHRLGEALRKFGRPQDAIVHLRKAVELEPNAADMQHSLGAALASAGCVSEAAEYYRRAIEMNPNLTAARLNLGIVEKFQGNSAEALRLFSKAVELDPKSAISRSLLGRSLEAMGDYPAAVKQYREAVRLQPNSPQATYELAKCLLKSGSIEESIQTFQKAVKLDSGFTDAHANLAVALLKAGKIAEAIVTLGKALALSEKNADLFNALGLAFAKMGKSREAARQFEKALSMDPDHADAKTNLEELVKESH